MKNLSSTEILRALLDHLDIVVWAVDPEGILLYEDGKGLKGTDPATLVGKSAFDLYPGQQTDGLRKALSGKQARVVTTEDGVNYFDNFYLPLKDAQGSVTGVIGMSVDVTQTEQAQRELAAKLEVIERQQEVIKNLETPILQVWDGVVALPLVGVLDSSRSARVMDDLLNAISRTGARFALLDLTGVDVVDTSTANHLIGMVRAIGLLGAEGVVTGIRPNVAQTIISLGMDLSKLKTLGNLRQGLSYCIQRMTGGNTALHAGARKPLEDRGT